MPPRPDALPRPTVLGRNGIEFRQRVQARKENAPYSQGRTGIRERIVNSLAKRTSEQTLALSRTGLERIAGSNTGNETPVADSASATDKGVQQVGRGRWGGETHSKPQPSSENNRTYEGRSVWHTPEPRHRTHPENPANNDADRKTLFEERYENGQSFLSRQEQTQLREILDRSRGKLAKTPKFSEADAEMYYQLMVAENAHGAAGVEFSTLVFEKLMQNDIVNPADKAKLQAMVTKIRAQLPKDALVNKLLEKGIIDEPIAQSLKKGTISGTLLENTMHYSMNHVKSKTDPDVIYTSQGLDLLASTLSENKPGLDFNRMVGGSITDRSKRRDLWLEFNDYSANFSHGVKSRVGEDMRWYSAG